MREPCQAIIRAAGDGRIRLHASVELVQELVFHRMRRVDRGAAVAQARDAAQLCTLHEFDSGVLGRALDLITSHPVIGGRDAVHAATALHAGLAEIVSPDAAFEGLDGVRRISPQDLAAQLIT
jgi:predicted nucleic acid-binding protein